MIVRCMYSIPCLLGQLFLSFGLEENTVSWCCIVLLLRWSLNRKFLQSSCIYTEKRKWACCLVTSIPWSHYRCLCTWDAFNSYTSVNCTCSPLTVADWWAHAELSNSFSKSNPRWRIYPSVCPIPCSGLCKCSKRHHADEKRVFSSRKTKIFVQYVQ